MTNKYPGIEVLPVEIDGPEKLAHCVLSSSDVRGNGNIKPNAFSLPKSRENPDVRVREISVDRFDYLNMEEAILLGENRAKQRGEGRQLHGWAIISARDARGDGRRVISSPLDGNLAHGDIWLPELAATDEEERKFHQTALAELSRFLKYPAPDNWLETWDRC